jgi:hypothetical protein
MSDFLSRSVAQMDRARYGSSEADLRAVQNRCPLLLRQQSLAAGTVEGWRTLRNRSARYCERVGGCGGRATAPIEDIWCEKKSVVAVAGDVRGARNVRHALIASKFRIPTK